MRGFYSATLLDRLLHQFDNPAKAEADLGKQCDLICGTSTGAILACGLAAGKTLPDIADFYRQHGEKIFPCPMPNFTAGRLTWLLCRFLGPAARAAKLRNGLECAFGSHTLGDIYRDREIALCFPAVNAATYKARVFKTPHIPGNRMDDDHQLVDICMACTAAPLFFPIHPIPISKKDKDDRGDKDYQYFVDGGLWANNAVLLALVEALRMTEMQRDIEILSVGTASPPKGDTATLLKDLKWGAWKWKVGIEINEMSISAQEHGYDSIAKIVARTLSQAMSRDGLKMEVVRLAEVCRSGKRYAAINLDRAGKTAIKAMIEMADEDAASICSNEEAEGYSLVRDFFHKAPPRR